MTEYIIQEDSIKALVDIVKEKDDGAVSYVTDGRKFNISKLPEGVTTIGAYAFYYRTRLTLTELPNSLTTIGTCAFYGCTGITSITFKGAPTTIASNAFSGCTNLITINVPWAEGAVANAPWGATNATINYNYREV